MRNHQTDFADEKLQEDNLLLYKDAITIGAYNGCYDNSNMHVAIVTAYHILSLCLCHLLCEWSNIQSL